MRGFIKKTLLLAIMAAAVFTASCKTAEKPVFIKNPPALTAVEPYGEVPEEFKSVVFENKFFSANPNKYGVVRVKDDKDGQTVSLMDFYGNVKLEFFEEWREYHKITYAAATDDGGLIYVNGFVWWYYDIPGEETGTGVDGEQYTEIIKRDKNGNTEWKTHIKNQEGDLILAFYEKADSYVFLWETTVDFETGEYAPAINIEKGSWFVMTEISRSGKMLRYEKITDYYMLIPFTVRVVGDDVILWCRMKEREDSEENNFQSLYFDKELNFKKSKKAGMTDGYLYLGYLNGSEFYSCDFFVKDFNDGYLTSVTDYGEFFLAVSENAVSIKEKFTENYKEHYIDRQRSLPYSAPVYMKDDLCTETVYGCYDKKGKLLWRTSVRSDDLIYHDYTAYFYDGE